MVSNGGWAVLAFPKGVTDWKLVHWKALSQLAAIQRSTVWATT